MILLKAVMSGLCGILSAVQLVFEQDYTGIVAKLHFELSLVLGLIPFILKGCSFHLRGHPMFSDGSLIGAGSYSLGLPDFPVDINAVNRNPGLGWVV